MGRPTASAITAESKVMTAELQRIRAEQTACREWLAINGHNHSESPGVRMAIVDWIAEEILAQFSGSCCARHKISECANNGASTG